MTPLPSPPSTASRRRLPHPQGVAFPLGMEGAQESSGVWGKSSSLPWAPGCPFRDSVPRPEYGVTQVFCLQMVCTTVRIIYMSFHQQGNVHLSVAPQSCGQGVQVPAQGAVCPRGQGPQPPTPRPQEKRAESQRQDLAVASLLRGSRIQSPPTKQRINPALRLLGPHAGGRLGLSVAVCEWGRPLSPCQGGDGRGKGSGSRWAPLRSVFAFHFAFQSCITLVQRTQGIPIYLQNIKKSVHLHIKPHSAFYTCTSSEKIKT